MTKEEAKRKMIFIKEAYQKLIDEGVDNGTLVGTGVRGTWKSDTTLTEAYKDMIDACDVAIKALEQEPCEDAVSREFMYKLGAKCIAARNKNGELVAITSIESLPPVTVVHI